MRTAQPRTNLKKKMVKQINNLATNKKCSKILPSFSQAKLKWNNTIPRSTDNILQVHKLSDT
jgi:hypothetical protein